MEDYIDIQFPEEKKIFAVINGENYTFNAYFSINDYETVIDELKKDNFKYKDIVAEVILNHVCKGNMGRIEVSALPEELILNYINEVVKGSKQIGVIYEDNFRISDVYERFIVSVKENINNEIGVITESLANIKLPEINLPKCYFEQLTEMFNINNFIPDLSAITEGLSLIAQSTMNTQDIVKNITESLQSIVEMQQSFVLQIEKQVTQVLSQFSLFSYTEEKREEIRVAICKWGEYGWTIPEHANMYEFMEKPISAKEANNIASKYCTNEYMDKLFENIKKFGCVRQSDFSEAIENYRDKRYKSCACIMFSLIDAKLIRMQPREELGRPVNRFVGKKAVEKSKEKIINTKSNIKNTLFSILRLENVYSCLMKFFEKGNNFEKQPEVINRNFLVHGMLIRQVTKRDCKQLFLLYYNWLSLLER